MATFTLIDAAGGSSTLSSLGLIVERVIGLGMPDVTNIATPYALLDGSMFQRSLVQSKSVQIICAMQGTSLANLHALKKALIGKLNRDATAVQVPVWLRYDGSGTTYEIPLYYEAGIDTEMDGLTFNRFALRFTCYDPYWRAVSDSTVSLWGNTTIANANYILRKTAGGVWSTMGGLDGEVYAIALDPSTGYLWVGGDFTIAGSTTVYHITYWDGSAWHAVNGAGVNGIVKAIVCGGGYVYAAGAFETAMSPGTWLGGIARYNSDGTALTALGGGLAAYGGAYDVRALALLPDGTLYVGGNFSSALDAGINPIANTAYIAKWNGSAWVSVGNANNPVVTLVARGTSEIYAGGTFTLIGGVSATELAKWNGSTWVALGTGVDDTPYCMTIGRDRNVYIGGAFRVADGATALRVCRWNGVGLYPLGSGVGGAAYDGVTIVRSMAVTADGTLYVGGVVFMTAGEVSLTSPIAVWNGSAFVPEDIDLPGSPAVRGMASDSDGNLYIGFSTSGSAVSPGHTTVTNGGTARAYPILTINITGGTLRIRGLYNYTEGKMIYVNYVMASGDTVTLDLTPGQKSMHSAYYGDVSGYILPSSDLSTWSLLPGSNDIGLLIKTNSGSPTVNICSLAWRNRNWSAD